MTFAEIQSAVQGNPALLTEIANGFGKDIIPVIGQNDELFKGVVPVLGQKGYIVRTQSDEQSYLDKFKTQVIEQDIPARIKAVHDQYDNDLFELTGERKAPTEKTYDFVKRKITEIKTSKIEDPVLKEQLQTLQRQLEDKEKVHKKVVDDIESKYFGREIDMLVTSDLSQVNIALPAHLKTDDEKQKYISSQKSLMKKDLLSSFQAKQDNDGNIIFYEGDKQLISNTDGKPLKPLDIIKDKYAFYIAKDEGRQQNGGGTGGNGGQGTFTTKEEVYKYLETKGIEPLTKQFNDEYAKLVKEHGIIN